MTSSTLPGALKRTAALTHPARRPGGEEGRPQGRRRARGLLLPWLLLATGAGAQPDVGGYKLEGAAGQFSLGVDPQNRRGAKPAIALRATDGAGEGSMTRSIKASIYRGKKVRLTGWLKGDGASRATLFLRAMDADGKPLAAEERREGVGSGADWSQHSLTLAVPRDAATVEYGVQLSGKGAIWVDNLQLVAVK